MILCWLFGGMQKFREACTKIGIKHVIFKDINELKTLPHYKDIDIPQKEDELAHIADEDAKVERKVYLAVMYG